MRKYEITRTIKFKEVSYQALDKQQGIVVECKDNITTTATKEEDLIKILSGLDPNLVPFKVLQVNEHRNTYGMSLNTFIENASVITTKVKEEKED